MDEDEDGKSRLERVNTDKHTANKKINNETAKKKTLYLITISAIYKLDFKIILVKAAALHQSWFNVDQNIKCLVKRILPSNVCYMPILTRLCRAPEISVI